MKEYSSIAKFKKAVGSSRFDTLIRPEDLGNGRNPRLLEIHSNQLSDILRNSIAPEGSNFRIANLKVLRRGVSGSGGAFEALKEMSETKGKWNTPLYDTELIEMLSPYKDFVGVIMRDELPELLEKMKREDRDKFGFIINTKGSDEDGEHWQALYVDLTDKKEVCFYDSFGRPIQKDVLAVLKKWVAEQGLPYLLKYKNNRVTHQVSNSNRCGFHSARFLIDMFKGLPFSEATDFDSVKDGEDNAVGLEKKYRMSQKKGFGYI